MIYLRLFWAFFQVGLFSVGGGYASIPLIQQQVISNEWLSLSEFTDLVSIAEMTPGAIAINASTFVGTRIAGIPGALIATFGCVLPSCAILLIISVLYKKYSEKGLIQGVLAGLRPAVVGLIASAGVSMIFLSLFGMNGVSLDFSGASFNAVALVFILLAFILLKKFKPNPIIIIAAAGIAGLFIPVNM